MALQVAPLDTYNARLVANVHPPDWVNPTAEPRYNLVVLGAGTAGLVARVGLSEQEAREEGIPVRAFVQELSDVDRAVLDSEANGFVKVLVKEGTDRIVGATTVAAHAGEMISEVTLAMVGGLGLRTLAQTIHPYPTQAEALKKIADAYNRTRLTPFVMGLFRKWLRWTR